MSASSTLPPSPRRRLVLALMGSSGAMVACGGGGVADLIAGVGTGGTGSYASGAIRGFGSIIVNQVRYDDSRAQVLDDNGVTIGSAGLRLGMTVDVEASDITADAAGIRRATASVVRVKPEIIGPVQSVNAATAVVGVLGQAVQVPATATLDERLTGGVAAIRVGQIVAVYGLRDGAGQVIATRIDLVVGASSYRLRGAVARVDAANQRIDVGTASIDYRQAVRTGLTRTPAVGDFVKVEIALTASATGVWTAQKLELQGTSLPTETLSGKGRVEIEGLITALTSATRFRVSGLEIDASRVVGLPTGLAVNQRVEVKGTLVGGVLVAQEVERDGSTSAGSGEFEVNGPITRIDTASRTIEVRGLLIRYANARFKDGTVTNLKLGVTVEVKGQLAADGFSLEANEIDFD